MKKIVQNVCESEKALMKEFHGSEKNMKSSVLIVSNSDWKTINFYLIFK